MPIMLGVLAAILVGISDTLGRAGTRRANSVSHVSSAMFIGIPITLVAALLSGAEWRAGDLLSGAVSGFLVAGGLGVAYRGMADSSAAVVSPISAVFAALIPLVWDILGGLRPGVQVSIGCAVAITSLALTTFNKELSGKIRIGVAYGLLAGFMFGAGVIFVADTAEASGVLPAFTQRLVGFSLMATLATRRSLPVFLPGKLLKIGLLSGVFGTFGMMSWVIGSQQGDLGTVSVAGSMFPAVVAVLAATFDDDQLRWWQGLGILGAIIGMGLIALA